jgi:hypothetical protein
VALYFVIFVARVVSAIKGAEIWLSNCAKDDITRLGSTKHKRLRWKRHDSIAMKGFLGHVHSVVGAIAAYCGIKGARLKNKVLLNSDCDVSPEAER